jgi:hypothetical protein
MPKGPSLFLNALLANDIYTHLSRNPFFFFDDDTEYGPTVGGLAMSLNQIYTAALACKLGIAIEGGWSADNPSKYRGRS